MITSSFHRVAALTLISTAALAFPQLSHASHFRGGSITWQAKALDADGVKDDIEVTVKTAWAPGRGIEGDMTSLASTPSISGWSQLHSELTTVSTPDGGYELATVVLQAKGLDPDTSYLVNFSGCCRISNLENNANGNWNIQSIVNLKNGNLAPKIDLPIIFDVPQLQADGVTTLQTYSFDLGSKDPNADKLRYRMANLDELGGGTSTNPVGMSINPNTGLVTWTDSGTLTSGLYSGGFVAEDVDENGNVKSKTHVDMIFSLVNAPQTEYSTVGVPATKNIIVEKGSTASFSISGSAIDTQSLGSVQGALAESTTTANNYTFDPGPVGSGLDPGSYPITFVIQNTDINTTKADDYLILNFVVPDPNAPKVTNLEADRVTYTGSGTVRVDANGDAQVSDIDTADFQGGFLMANVTFTDGQFEVLDVESGVDGISRSGDGILYNGAAFATVDATLDGAGRALRIDFTGPTSVAAVRALVHSLNYQDTFPLRAAGDRALSLFVQDPEGHSNSYDFFVAVDPHPDAGNYVGTPLIAANQITLVEGDAIALSNENISSADPEGDPITLTVSSVVNGHFAYVSAPGTAITSFTQAEINSGQIAFVHDGSESAPAYELAASDGTNSTAPSAGTVTFTTVADQAPVMSGTPATSVAEASAYAFTPTVTDGDTSDSVSYSVANLPSWASFNPATGALSGTPGPNDVGTYPGVAITATDSGGLSDTIGPFTITVTAAPDGDGDGVPDYVETAQGSDPQDPSSFPDSDRDGVPDHVESYTDGTDPGDAQSWRDSDGDGVSDYLEQRENTDPNDPTDFPFVTGTVDATGYHTKVTRAELIALGLIGAGDADKCCGDFPVAAVDGEPLFRPGRNVLTWAGDGRNILNVRPLISLGQTQLIAEGQRAAVTVYLNGPAPAYPLTVPFEVAGSAGAGDHDLASRSVTFNPGETQAQARFTVTADGIGEGEETLVISLPDDAGLNLGSPARQTLRIVEDNVAPEVSLAVEQGGQPTLTVTHSGGPVTITANVVDPNTGDRHGHDWGATSGLLIDTDAAGERFTFDPSAVAAGIYKVGVTVTDDGRPAASRASNVFVRVVERLPDLSAGTDSDGDGVDDASEGSGDADGDGTPDYLDAYGNNVLPERGAVRDAFLVECDVDARCRLGEHAMRGSHQGVQLARDDLSALPGLAPDADYTNVGGTFDFEAEVPQVGDSVRVVIPQRLPVPEGAVYRKFRSDYGWSDFREDAGNRLYSTAGERGYCPPPGDASWQPGLTAGHWCVQLLIEDGGPNDADGQSDGVVVDPGGVGTAANVPYQTTGGGGATGAPMLLLMLMGALWRLRAKWTGRRAAAALLLGGLAALAPAQAQEEDEQAAGGWHSLYISGTVGYADTDVSRGDMQAAFAQRGIGATVDAVDGSRLGWSLGLGYSLSERWAVEAAYLDLGEVEVDFTAPSTRANLAEVYPDSGRGAALSGLYRQPLGSSFELRARLGLFAWKQDYTTRRAGTQVDTYDESGTDLYWGMGAGYRLAERWSLSAELQRFEFDDEPTHYLSVGVQWRPKW